MSKAFEKIKTGLVEAIKMTEVMRENDRLRADLAAVTAQRDMMRDALKPFVNIIDQKFQIYDYEHNDIRMSLVNFNVLMRICNNAKDALEGVMEKEGAGNE